MSAEEFRTARFSTDGTEQLMALKKRVDACRAKAERAAGVVEKLTEELKTQWGCASLGEGVEKLREMGGELEKLESDYKAQLANFEERWGEKLRELDKLS